MINSKYVSLSAVMQEIRDQYTAHNEVIPEWLSFADISESNTYMRCPCCNNVYCLQSHNIAGNKEKI